MSFIKRHYLKFLSIFYVVFLPLILHAGDEASGGCSPGTICNPIPSVGSIPELIVIILEGVVTIGIPIVALGIIFSGFLFVFAKGNPEKLTTAKAAFIGSCCGGALVLGSYTIAQGISYTINALS